MLQRCALRGMSTAGETQRYNLIGPPDKLSNIRPIQLRTPSSLAEARVQELQAQVWHYNHEFWARHNAQFKQGKEEFTRVTLRQRGEPAVSKLSAQELSVFYKSFLDDKYSHHVDYTKGWLRLQFKLTWSILKLNLTQLLSVFTRHNKYTDRT